MRKSNITVHLWVAMLLHIAAVVVAVHLAHVAWLYWGQFLEGIPFPVLFLFVIATAQWLPVVALAVLVTGAVVGFKASDRTARHFIVGVMALSIVILSVTAIGLGQPMSVAARIMKQKAANQASQAIGAEAAPQPER